MYYINFYLILKYLIKHRHNKNLREPIKMRTIRLTSLMYFHIEILITSENM